MDPGGCPHQDSLAVTETWVISIGITYCNEIQRSVSTTSNRHQIVGSDSLHGVTVLSLPVVFPMLGSI
jgi:hypothetical protein